MYQGVEEVEVLHSLHHYREEVEVGVQSWTLLQDLVVGVELHLHK